MFRMLSATLFNRQFIVGLVFLFALPLQAAQVSAAVAAKDIHEITDICAKLQQAIKDYTLVGMGVRYENPAEDLVKVISVIDTDFAHLVEGSHLGATRTKEVKSLQAEWQALKATLSAAPAQDKVIKLHDDINLLSDRCKKLAEALAEETDIPGEKYVVVSAELLIDVQQLAALYMMAAWQVPAPHYKKEAEEILADFEQHLHVLAKADVTFVPEKTKKKIKAIDEEFILFEHMALSSSGRYVPTLAQRKAKVLHAHTLELAQEVLAQVEKGSK